MDNLMLMFKNTHTFYFLVKTNNTFKQLLFFVKMFLFVQISIKEKKDEKEDRE